RGGIGRTKLKGISRRQDTDAVVGEGAGVARHLLTDFGEAGRMKTGAHGAAHGELGHEFVACREPEVRGAAEIGVVLESTGGAYVEFRRDLGIDPEVAAAHV